MIVDASSEADWPAGVRIAVGGRSAFACMLQCIDTAEASIELRAYIWRDDATGRAVARALLDAADRGVAVRIIKSADAVEHEVHEAGGQSFFHKRMGVTAHVRASALHGFYGNRLKLARQQPNPLAPALAQHPNIDLHIDDHYDHSKVLIVDERRMMLGGMCIGDDAHFDLIDYMVELDGARFVERLRARWAGMAPYDPTRAWDFLVNGAGEDLRADRLALLAQARRRLRIEMAFFGDPAFSDAICAAVDRGVHTTIVASRRAGKLRWYNPQIFNAMRAQTGAPGHLRIALHRRVVHAKLMVVDDAWVDMGSANFTRLSHEGYGETNVYFNDPRVARRLGQIIDAHAAESRVARRRIRYSKVRARLELHFMNRAGTAAQRRIARQAAEADR